MHIYFVNHADDDDAVAETTKTMEPRGFERVEDAADADLAVLLVSGPALRDGLGDVPSALQHTGVRVLPVLWGKGMLPDRFPVHRKHMHGARVPMDLVKLLVDERKRFGRKIIDSKKDLFGYGLYLGLVHRAP